MSVRSLARHFRAEVGTTPHKWLTHQRLLAAQRQLETTDESIDLNRRSGGYARPRATLRYITFVGGFERRQLPIASDSRQFRDSSGCSSGTLSSVGAPDILPSWRLTSISSWMNSATPWRT